MSRPPGAPSDPARSGSAGGRRPLSGRVVLLTRPREQAGELARLLERRGAEVILAPTIETAPAPSRRLDRAVDDLAAGRFAWLVLTSRAGVEALAAHLADRALGPPVARAKIAVVGEGTAGAFRGWARRRADLIPRTFTTEALARAFPRGEGRVLLARADVAPAGLEEALAGKGWTPVRVDAYRTKLARSLPREAREALAEGRVDALTFTSASTVRGYKRALIGPRGRGAVVRGTPKVVCIGPIAAREARQLGFTVHAVARPHTIEGLAAAVERALTPRRRGTATG